MSFERTKRRMYDFFIHIPKPSTLEFSLFQKITIIDQETLHRRNGLIQAIRDGYVLILCEQAIKGLSFENTKLLFKADKKSIISETGVGQILEAKGLSYQRTVKTFSFASSSSLKAESRNHEDAFGVFQTDQNKTLEFSSLIRTPEVVKDFEHLASEQSEQSLNQTSSSEPMKHPKIKIIELCFPIFEGQTYVVLFEPGTNEYSLFLHLCDQMYQTDPHLQFVFASFGRTYVEAQSFQTAVGGKGTVFLDEPNNSPMTSFLNLKNACSLAQALSENNQNVVLACCDLQGWMNNMNVLSEQTFFSTDLPFDSFEQELCMLLNRSRNRSDLQGSITQIIFISSAQVDAKKTESLLRNNVQNLLVLKRHPQLFRTKGMIDFERSSNILQEPQTDLEMRYRASIREKLFHLYEKFNLVKLQQFEEFSSLEKTKFLEEMTKLFEIENSYCTTEEILIKAEKLIQQYTEK